MEETALPDPAPRPPEESTGTVWPVLSPDALYGLAGDVVRTIGPHTEADPAALLMQFLTAIGNVLGRDLYATAEDARHGLNLNVVLVGDSSKGRKGTSWARIKSLISRTDDRWSRKQIVSGLSSGEGLIERFEYIDEDDNVNDKRLLVVQSEFASVLKVMERPGNTLSPVIRDLWDCLEVIQTLTRKKNKLYTTNPHLSIIAHITLDELLKQLCETETMNGFANRFLLVLVKRSRCLPEGSSIPEDELHTLAEQMCKVVTAWKGREQRFKRDDKARELWAQDYERLSEGKPGLFGAATNRAEAQVLRISCIYPALDCSAVVRIDHLNAALAVWDYCQQSAALIFGDATGDSVADKILNALVIGDLTRNEIRESVFQRNMPAARIDIALRMLLKSGRITVRREETEGRPVEIFSLVRGTR